MPELRESGTRNESVLPPEEAHELARLLRILIGHDPTGAGIREIIKDAAAEVDAGREGDRAALVAKARAVFSERKRRTQFFGRVMFSEPAWDMLLALYITDFAEGMQTVGKLVSWIAAPQTTALRWILYLEREKFITREKHPKDSRSTLVHLTDRGRKMLDRYFSTLPYSLTSV